MTIKEIQGFIYLDVLCRVAFTGTQYKPPQATGQRTVSSLTQLKQTCSKPASDCSKSALPAQGSAHLSININVCMCASISSKEKQERNNATVLNIGSSKETKYFLIMA